MFGKAVSIQYTVPDDLITAYRATRSFFFPLRPEGASEQEVEEEEGWVHPVAGSYRLIFEGVAYGILHAFQLTNFGEARLPCT